MAFRNETVMQCRVLIQEKFFFATDCNLALYFLQEQLSLYISETIRVSTGDKQLRKAEERRHTMSAKELWRKVGLFSQNVDITIRTYFLNH